MAITIHFAPEVEAQLQERARRSGVDVTTYIYQVVEKDLHERRTFDEILEPIRQGFEESGLTEEELEALFEQAREAVWQEKTEGNQR
jgi:post-segregation antitoxin (ccd killing protein)